ncbi:MAG: CsbD family protein [Bdellovibrionales bacterium]|nr:CsbD family protein [Bdellovibrionales bacterium]
MNWDQVEGSWKQLKGKAKQKWAKLSDSDLTAIEGKRDELVGKLQENYGYARERAEREADDFVQGCNC